MSKALVKNGGEVQAQDFDKALSEAFERVEKAPKKKKRKKKKKEIAALAQRVVHNPAFDVEVVTGRTSARDLNIQNPPRSDELRTSIAQRKVASGGSATSLFIGDAWNTDDKPLDIKAQVQADSSLTWSFTLFGKAVL